MDGSPYGYTPATSASPPNSLRVFAGVEDAPRRDFVAPHNLNATTSTWEPQAPAAALSSTSGPFASHFSGHEAHRPFSFASAPVAYLPHPAAVQPSATFLSYNTPEPLPSETRYSPSRYNASGLTFPPPSPEDLEMRYRAQGPPGVPFDPTHFPPHQGHAPSQFHSHQTMYSGHVSHEVPPSPGTRLVAPPTGPAWGSPAAWHQSPQRRSSNSDEEEYSPTVPQIFRRHVTPSYPPPTLPPPVHTIAPAAAIPLAPPSFLPNFPPAQQTQWQPINKSSGSQYLPHHPLLFDLSPSISADLELQLGYDDPSPSTSSHSVSSSSIGASSVAYSDSQSFLSPDPSPSATPALSTPPLPGAVHPAAQLAASHRVRVSAATPAIATPAKVRRQTMKTDDDDGSERRSGGRSTLDHECVCAQCVSAIGKLIFRGTREELKVSFRAHFLCVACAPLPQEGSWGGDDDISYADTLSAAVDRLQGISIAEPDQRPPPPRARATSGQNKKRRTGNSDILVCDVCTRDVATGAITPANPREEIDFGIEVICSNCRERYSRCTDCGGGGGPRIGIGKWRSKELFPNGRRTCVLSHLRLGSLDDMSYDIWPVADLPTHELDEINQACRELYMHNMYSGLATPEVLEPVTALARTYEEVKSLTMDSWALIEPMLREQVQPERNVRRYLALRWSKPAPRKRNKNLKTSVADAGSSEEDVPPSMIRRGKNLAGFVLAELDLLTGSLFLAVTTPWATGETYDATTFLMQTLLRRIEGDIVWLNSHLTPHQHPYPALDNAWLMMFFKKDSRLLMHLENRRGFYHLDDYLEKYPATRRETFAPYRSVFVPPEYLRGWNVLVRKIVPNDDWNARPAVDKRRRLTG